MQTHVSKLIRARFTNLSFHCPHGRVQQFTRSGNSLPHSFGMFLVILLGLPVFADHDPLVESIAAQQRSTGEIYDSLSFSATIRTRTSEELTPELIEQSQRYSVSKRGDSLLFTRESSTVVEEFPEFKDGELLTPIFKVISAPIDMRLLFADDYVARWNDMSQAVASLYTAEAWRRFSADEHRRLKAFRDAAAPERYCFGLFTPFYELLAQSNDFVEWDAHDEGKGTYRLSRTIHLPDGTLKNDLTMLVDARHGVLLSANFKPDGSTSKCRITYEGLNYNKGFVLVPRTLHYSTLEADQKIIEDITIEFFDFRDESALPKHQLDSMELPEGTVVLKTHAGGETEAFSWRSGELAEPPVAVN